MTITTPPLAGSSAKHVVGNVARVGVERRASEWEKITGARLAAIASFIVAGETWLRSTSMPSRFISLTTLTPNGLRPSILRLVGAAVGPFGRLVVGQRHVAHAELVELAKRGQRAADLPPALDAEQ